MELDRDAIIEVEENLQSLLKEELEGACAERVAKASINVWKMVFEHVTENLRDASGGSTLHGTHIAPGWSYAIDFAKTLSIIIESSGRESFEDLCGDSEKARTACKVAIDAWYTEYLKLVMPELSPGSARPLVNQLTEQCVKDLVSNERDRVGG